MDYLDGFIKQFEEELSDEDWTVTRWLMWLKLNNFEINKKEIWSVFNADILIEKNLVNKTFLYRHDLSTIDFENDWRFSTVHGKRENVKFLGLISDPVFPLEFPLNFLKNE